MASSKVAPLLYDQQCLRSLRFAAHVPLSAADTGCLHPLYLRWCVTVVQGHSRSSNLIAIDSSYAITNETSSVILLSFPSYDSLIQNLRLVPFLPSFLSPSVLLDGTSTQPQHPPPVTTTLPTYHRVCYWTERQRNHNTHLMSRQLYRRITECVTGRNVNATTTPTTCHDNFSDISPSVLLDRDWPNIDTDQASRYHVC